MAKYLKRDCYGLVFGFNKFIAYILITMLTVVIVEDTFFSFDIRKQVEFIFTQYITICLYNNRSFINHLYLYLLYIVTLKY